MKRSIGDGLRMKWLTADELYGRVAEFRRESADLGLLYVVEVPCDTTGWTAAMTERGDDARRVDALWRRGGPSWEMYHVKDTEKGPVVWEARAVRFRPHEAKGEVGMKHFEVRRYRPVMRHLVLSMVSLLFLCEEVKRLRGEKPVVEHLAGEVRRRRAG